MSLPPPESFPIQTADWIWENCLRPVFGTDWDGLLALVDEWYRLPTDDVVRAFLDADGTDRFPYQSVVSDCLSPDTPVIYKNPLTGEVDIAEVQELPPEGGVQILDMDGDDLSWTRVNWVRAKYSNKRLITVAAPGGFIQATEDHRFWIRERWCRIGAFVRSEEGRGRGKVKPKVAPIEKLFPDNFDLDPDLAWVYGLFMAEGSCQLEAGGRSCAYSWHIDMADEDILLRAKETLESHYDLKFEVTLPPSQRAGIPRGGVIARRDLYRLLPRGNGYGSAKSLAVEFRRKFYTKGGSKKVPLDVLRASLKAKESFVRGFMLGDGSTQVARFGNREYVFATAYQKSRVALLGLEILLRKLRINHRYLYERKPSGKSYFSLVLKEGTTKTPRSNYYFVDAGGVERLVYDLNTETGHFVAGTYLVHNCDDFSQVLHGMFERTCWGYGFCFGQIYWWSNLNRAGHAQNLYVNDRGEVRIVEPQTDGVMSWSDILSRYPDAKPFLILL